MALTNGQGCDDSTGRYQQGAGAHPFHPSLSLTLQTVPSLPATSQAFVGPAGSPNVKPPGVG